MLRRSLSDPTFHCIRFRHPTSNPGPLTCETFQAIVMKELP